MKPTRKKREIYKDHPPRSSPEYDAFYRKKRKDDLAKYQAEYAKKKREEDPEYFKRIAKKHYDINNGIINAKCRTNYSENKDHFIKRIKKWISENPESRKRTSRIYAQKNRDYISQRENERYVNDIQFCISVRLRARCRLALNAAQAKKSSRFTDLLGCSENEFMIHIESQFVDGMCWDNRSLWHLDHIYPLSRFNLVNQDHQSVAFHHSNLQPMWKRDNLLKSNKLPDVIPVALAYKLKDINLL